MKPTTKTKGAASRRPAADAARDRIRKRLQRVITPRDAAAFDAENQAQFAERRCNPDGFEALDPVMQAWTKAKGTLAVVSVLLHIDNLDEAAACTMERHIEADSAALEAALDHAWDQLVRARVPT
jgi:hypothetical protein